MSEVSIARRLWDDFTAMHAQDLALFRDWYMRCEAHASRRTGLPYGWLLVFPDGSFLSGVGQVIIWGFGASVTMPMPPFLPSRN
jgi:hypothetical protein